MIKSETTNSFQGGLDMDKHPMILDNKTYTYALNATLATNNGNEGLMLNDMGNTLVGNVKLPDGYTPIGTCEFGGIIYIVSHNPVTKHSQIGSFPSPLRLHFNNENLFLDKNITDGDFISTITKEELEKYHLPESTDTKIISFNKLIELTDNTLFPGDKYIVYKKDGDNYQNVKTIGNSDTISLSLVSITDSGDIISLDNIKLYEWEKDNKKIQYYIYPTDFEKSADDAQSIKNNIFSIFSSKKAGKLGILATLNKPEKHGLRASMEKTETGWELNWIYDYDPLIEGYSINGKYYPCKLDDSNKPKPIIYEQAKKESEDKSVEILETDKFEGIKEYHITPKLKSGYWLEQYDKISIDWDKVDTGYYEISLYKYYVHENSVEIQYIFSMYPYYQLTVTGIDFEFYGIEDYSNPKATKVGTYELRYLDSYNGEFILNIPINDSGTIPEFKKNEKGFKGDIPEELYESDSYIIVTNDNEKHICYYNGKEFIEDSKVIKDSNIIAKYANNAGKLFSDLIYGIKVIIHTEKGEKKQNYEGEKYNRILWTIPNLNEYYYMDDLELPTEKRSDFKYYTNKLEYEVEFIGNSKLNNEQYTITPEYKYIFDNSLFSCSNNAFNTSINKVEGTFTSPDNYVIIDLYDNEVNIVPKELPTIEAKINNNNNIILIQSILQVPTLEKVKSNKTVTMYLMVNVGSTTKTSGGKYGFVAADVNRDKLWFRRYVESPSETTDTAYINTVYDDTDTIDVWNGDLGTSTGFEWFYPKHMDRTWVISSINDFQRNDARIAYNFTTIKSDGSVNDLGWCDNLANDWYTCYDYTKDENMYYLLAFPDLLDRLRLMNMHVPSTDIGTVTEKIVSILKGVFTYDLIKLENEILTCDYSGFTVDYFYTLACLTEYISENILYRGYNLSKNPLGNEFPDLLYKVPEISSEFNISDKKNYIPKIKSSDIIVDGNYLTTKEEIKPGCLYYYHKGNLSEILESDIISYTYKGSELLCLNFGRIFTIKDKRLVLKETSPENLRIYHIAFGWNCDERLGYCSSILESENFIDTKYMINV